MIFQNPETVAGCANVMKCIYSNYNLYLLIQEDNVKILELLMITNPPESDELEYLLSFVFEEETMRPILTATGNITITDYYLAVKCIAEFIYNLNLVNIFNSEISLIDHEKIEKAKMKVQKYLNEFKQDVNKAMELIFTESLRG